MEIGADKNRIKETDIDSHTIEDNRVNMDIPTENKEKNEENIMSHTKISADNENITDGIDASIIKDSQMEMDINAKNTDTHEEKNINMNDTDSCKKENVENMKNTNQTPDNNATQQLVDNETVKTEPIESDSIPSNVSNETEKEDLSEKGQNNVMEDAPIVDIKIKQSPQDESTQNGSHDNAKYRAKAYASDGDDEGSSDSDSDSVSSEDIAPSRIEPPKILSENEEDDETGKDGDKAGEEEKKRGVRTHGEKGIYDLPPIEELKITVDESVNMLHIGNVSAKIDALVIVHGTPEHSPLDMDSILFLEDRKPFGKVFETLGPVKMPFYSVRFNSAEDIEEKGIEIGDKIYYAPEEEQFTSFVFVNNLIKQKGSDASWEHNNEPPPKFLDFSDDEQEKRAKAKWRDRNKDKEGENEDGSAKRGRHQRGNRKKETGNEHDRLPGARGGGGGRGGDLDRAARDDLHNRRDNLFDGGEMQCWPPRNNRGPPGGGSNRQHRPPPRPKMLPDGYSSGYHPRHNAPPNRGGLLRHPHGGGMPPPRNDDGFSQQQPPRGGNYPGPRPASFHAPPPSERFIQGGPYQGEGGRRSNEGDMHPQDQFPPPMGPRSKQGGGFQQQTRGGGFEGPPMSSHQPMPQDRHSRFSQGPPPQHFGGPGSFNHQPPSQLTPGGQPPPSFNNQNHPNQQPMDGQRMPPSNQHGHFTQGQPPPRNDMAVNYQRDNSRNMGQGPPPNWNSQPSYRQQDGPPPNYNNAPPSMQQHNTISNNPSQPPFPSSYGGSRPAPNHMQSSNQYHSTGDRSGSYHQGPPPHHHNAPPHHFGGPPMFGGGAGRFVTGPPHAAQEGGPGSMRHPHSSDAPPIVDRRYMED